MSIILLLLLLIFLIFSYTYIHDMERGSGFRYGGRDITIFDFFWGVLGFGCWLVGRKGEGGEREGDVEGDGRRWIIHWEI